MIRRSISFDCEKSIERPNFTANDVAWEKKVGRCCPMKTVGEEEVGVDVEQLCRVLEFDQGAFISYFRLGYFHFLYKCKGVQWLWMADNFKN